MDGAETLAVRDVAHGNIGKPDLRRASRSEMSTRQ
jgi:hypothetical protein